jgi:DNA-binding response OmpR family regulator
MKDFRHEQPVVLVVDDDREVWSKVTAALPEAKFACRCCATAEEAATTAETNPPDLILCNVNLQGESGLETCQRIKRRPGMEGVPVMFLSGTQLPDISRRSDAGSGIYSLRKPFDTHVLVELIDQALGVPQG